MALRLRSALLVAFLFATAMGYYHFKIFLPRAQAAYAARGMGNGYFFGDDFFPIWLTSREWRLHRVDPYSPAMTQVIQTGLFGRPLGTISQDTRNPNDPPENYREFSYPAFVDILALPSTWFPFPAVRVAGALILVLMTVGATVLWMQILDLPVSSALWAIVILLTLFSYPVLEGIAAVQAGLAVSFLLSVSLAMLKKDWSWPAGLFLALTTIKPQMTLLVIGCLLLWALSEWRQRWEFAAGLIGGGTLLCISGSFICTSWVTEWLHVLLGYGRYSQPPLLIHLFGTYLGKAFSLLLLAAAVVLAWRMRHASAKSPEFIRTIVSLLAIGVVVLLPGQAIYDHILLLPGILVLLRLELLRGEGKAIPRTRAAALVLTLTAAAIAWQWIAAVGVVGASFLVSGLSDFWALLPVRTAASVPFAVLACLGLMMRREEHPH
jgi:Glycosyltransferase family 87